MWNGGEVRWEGWHGDDEAERAMLNSVGNETHYLTNCTYMYQHHGLLST